MEVVASIVSGAVVETGRFLCGSIYSTIKNIVKGPQQLDVLEKKMKSLMALRNDAEQEMKRATQEGLVIKARATNWVGEVEEMQGKINDQIQEAKSSRCFLSCSTKRYRISKEVAEHLKEIERLREVGSPLALSVALSSPEVKAVEHIPGSSIQDQTASVSEDLAKTMTLLSEDKNGIIGIWGMGGVGKTNLVRNLNNKLLEINSNMPFSCVLWVTVSRNSDIKKLQIGIASRLGFRLDESMGVDRVAIQLYQRLKEESNVLLHSIPPVIFLQERFLLILDDVWEKIDLDKLGVPRPEVQSGSKIILTSRSLEVCRDMLTDVEVKMSVLRDEGAWQLFSRYARDVVTSEQIAPLAEAICKECKGLPLAIITMGAAMRGKTNPEVWKHALNQLHRSMPYAAGVEEALYKPLKWSYDSLEGKDLKTCFLYYSLFPEDFSINIDELVWYRLAEGLIDDGENYEVFYSRGITLIENLKDACLLEDGSDEGTVKMHDVVRDVSVWIASTCSEDGSKSLVRAGNGLKKISATELSNSLKRVSFMDNDLEKLPDDSVIRCSEASTFLLQNNPCLELIPEIFLERFKALRVLNFSRTNIKSLPDSLLQLDDLRALLLSNCKDLEGLPQLERLCRLQVLDLSRIGIRELPKGLEQLSNLRHLNLAEFCKLKVVKVGVISKLSRLEVLDLSNSGYIWGQKGAVQEEEACFEELQCLERLQVLSIRLKWNPCYTPQDTINSCDTLNIYQCESYIDLSGGQIGWLLRIASYLFLESCGGLNEMLQDLVINNVGRSFTYLKKLVIMESDNSFRTGRRAALYDLLPNLEELWLAHVNGIESNSELANLLGMTFQRLKIINVFFCPRIKYLLSLGNSNIRTMPNLE
ncbi:hypothetical protein I3760_01G039600, partial [Carya illinoinensis]